MFQNLAKNLSQSSAKKCCKTCPRHHYKVGRKNVAKFGRKCVAKFGRKMLQSSAEKCCKEWPKISVQNSVGKMVQIWPRKVRTKLLRNSTQKFGRECKNQMRSISAMNSQSSIDWVTVYEIRTCDLFKHQQKLQPLVGMLRRVSMLIGRPQPIDGRPRSKTIGEGRLEHRQNRTMRCASLDVNRDHASACFSLKTTCI